MISSVKKLRKVLGKARDTKARGVRVGATAVGHCLRTGASAPRWNWDRTLGPWLTGRAATYCSKQ